MSEYQIKVELPVDSALKSAQKNDIIQNFSGVLEQNDCKLISKEVEYIEKRSFEIPLILVVSLGVSASILSMINSVLGIYRNLGKDGKKGEVFVKRKDGTYAKIEEDMSSDDAKKLLDD